MAAPSQGSTGVVLNSWKEIASYLGRGVRTVQRYERELGLPVRRPHGRSRSAVIALSDELDLWLRHAPGGALDAPEFPIQVREPLEAHSAQVQQHLTLRIRCAQLCQEHDHIIGQLMANLQLMVQTVGSIQHRKNAMFDPGLPRAG